MKKLGIPTTDSVRELAEFWDAHDLTDFEDGLADVADPVFVRDPRDATNGAIRVRLEPGEAKAVEQMARAEGVSREELVREWELQKIAHPGSARRRSKAE